ncbi:FAD-binding monooxygenase [Pedobacter lusitanus]|uniref:FAD-binding monooxygenase n=1 Tax=Pedobacter lusitanus TaxID=1503925 RepID=A0A0D0GRR3_9SPHI|nr:FAD-dependent monooxygenase [Pedobacter lusitanus]KIO78875.1 FAD-binding monooxygenase [Pedobacter lusitanus]
MSGASFAGLTLAYWLNKFGYQVTVVELGKGLRKGGSPIDVRGKAMDVVKEMGILQKIKAHEFIHTDEIVNAKGETLTSFSVNALEEYRGDIEIHRSDLVEIIFEIVPKDEVEFIFGNSIKTLIQHENRVEISFENGSDSSFDFVFGADGTHSMVRRLVFGAEENFKKFFGVYFAFAKADHIYTGRSGNTGIIYRELGKEAVIYHFKDGANAILMFRAPKLDWNYRNDEQQKQILKEYFGNNTNWKIPDILDSMLHSDNLYFDEASQIHMPTWTKGRVALVGDAAYAPSFFTGMGTSLALEGATLLANELHVSEDYTTAFGKYNETFKPFAESIQARITRGLKVQLPETEEEFQASITALRNNEKLS